MYGFWVIWMRSVVYPLLEFLDRLWSNCNAHAAEVDYPVSEWVIVIPEVMPQTPPVVVLVPTQVTDSEIYEVDEAEVGVVREVRHDDATQDDIVDDDTCFTRLKRSIRLETIAFVSVLVFFVHLGCTIYEAKLSGTKNYLAQAPPISSSLLFLAILFLAYAEAAHMKLRLDFRTLMWYRLDGRPFIPLRSIIEVLIAVMTNRFFGAGGGRSRR